MRQPNKKPSEKKVNAIPDELSKTSIMLNGLQPPTVTHIFISFHSFLCWVPAMPLDPSAFVGFISVSCCNYYLFRFVIPFSLSFILSFIVGGSMCVSVYFVLPLLVSSFFSFHFHFVHFIHSPSLYLLDIILLMGR